MMFHKVAAGKSHKAETGVQFAHQNTNTHHLPSTPSPTFYQKYTSIQPPATYAIIYSNCSNAVTAAV